MGNDTMREGSDGGYVGKGGTEGGRVFLGNAREKKRKELRGGRVNGETDI